MKQLAFVSIFISLLFSIQACSQHNGPLTIVKYGPYNIKANIPFNVQKDGQSALWFKMNQDIDGKVYVVINGVRLNAIHRSDLVTIAVPANLFSKSGNYTIYIEVQNGAQTTKSNQLRLVVS